MPCFLVPLLLPASGAQVLILLVPLIIEMDREQSVIEMEKEQMNVLTAAAAAPAAKA